MNKSNQIVIGAALLVAAGVLVNEWLAYLRGNKWAKACESALGELNRNQERTIRKIVRGFERWGDGDPNKLAYILATVETECSFESKREHRTYSAAQNRYWGKYAGEGLVQLTGENNYRKASKLLNVDFLTYPHKAREMRYAVPILVRGMMLGIFTRKKLGDYINQQKVDFVGARWVVNGTDKNVRIAKDAINILNAYTMLSGKK